MSDLIDRQVAIDAVCDEWCGCKNKDCKHLFDPKVDNSVYCDGCDDVERIKQLPSAEPQIIHCKDCKHYQFADNRANRAFGMPVKMCKWFDFEDVDDDDFCSRAERMDVEHE